jgi:serine/threonine-protein kinase
MVGHGEATMSPVRVGEVLAGKYRVERVLGVGGMGVVVAATHLQLEERVALKFMLPEAFGAPESVTRFLREARAVVRLKSEHVARVLDVGTLETGSPYIVMEFLDGSDLGGLLDARGPLPIVEVADYVVQACDAIAEAHAQGIVHRDLKPANLFLVRRADGTPLVKVLDFGISKVAARESPSAMTSAGAMLGSPLYMSPEQMRSARDVDARTDVWALGVILYELVSGRPPFEAETLPGLCAAVMAEAPRPLGLVPPAFEAIVARCLEKDPTKRWESVAALVQALAAFCPARSRVIVDRVSAVLGTSSPSAATVGGAPAADAPSPAASTSATWGRTKGSTPSPLPRATAAVIGVGGVLLVATAVSATALLLGRTTRVAPSATAAAPPVPTDSVTPGEKQDLRAAASAAPSLRVSASAAPPVAPAVSSPSPTATATRPRPRSPVDRPATPSASSSTPAVAIPAAPQAPKRGVLDDSE